MSTAEPSRTSTYRSVKEYMLCIPDRAYDICQRPTSQLARGAFMGMTTANQFISRNLHTQKANLKIEGNVT